VPIVADEPCGASRGRRRPWSSPCPLFEPVQHFSSHFVRTGAPGGEVVEPVIDHLLGGRLLPDPLPGRAIRDFPGAFEEAAPTPDTQLTRLGKPLVMTI